MHAIDDTQFTHNLLALTPRLRAFARTLTGGHTEGEDLAQSTLLLSWRARSSFTPGTDLEAWVFRILRNQHITNVRRARRRPAFQVLNDEIENIASADDPQVGVELNEIRLALQTLAAEQREALILIGAAGWTYDEVAAYAACPIGTVKTRVFRARRAIARTIEEGCLPRDDLPAGRAAQVLCAIAQRLDAKRTKVSEQSPSSALAARRARVPVAHGLDV